MQFWTRAVLRSAGRRMNFGRLSLHFQFKSLQLGSKIVTKMNFFSCLDISICTGMPIADQLVAFVWGEGGTGKKWVHSKSRVSLLQKWKSHFPDLSWGWKSRATVLCFESLWVIRLLGNSKHVRNVLVASV